MEARNLAARHFCSVCHRGPLTEFARVGPRLYRRCGCCGATLMDPQGWLSPGEEREVYRLHDNAVDDIGYRRFLSKLADPLLQQLTPGLKGLDFGCGPGPALAAMLEEQGMDVARYDPAFFPDDSVFRQQWDFITCTEVIEHLKDPLGVFHQLDAMLGQGGVLGVMTCFQTDDSRFANWHYRRDPTHIVFYREQTLQWLADHLGWSLEIPCKDVAIFHKP
ncbi:class I SAM-dependent methyltransferase [Marinobacter lacisalsi]|uniref:Class I SAM-dependent methyltransferase n=1 Tax=Marinobacter lacisalsi TaxID=475979 RepID=A0ABV8QL25_9GAMM